MAVLEATQLPAQIPDLSLVPQPTLEQLTTKKVPESIIEQIKTDPNLELSTIEMRTSSESGFTPEVMAMVVNDLVNNHCTLGYELTQGLDDFGWLGKDAADWHAPFIEVTTPEETKRYDGTTTFSDAESVTFSNQGALSPGNVFLRAPSEETFRQAGGVDRKGGHGRGLKISLTAAVATPQELLTVLKQSLELSAKNTITSREKTEAAIKQLEEKIATLQQVDAPRPFVTIDAKSPDDGNYYRYYAYGAPVQLSNKPTWELQFVAVRYKADAVPESKKNQVQVTLHQPHQLTKEVLNQLPENVLICNSNYPSEHSLVRSDNNEMTTPEQLAAAGVKRFTLSNSEYYVGGTVMVERMKDVVAPGLYFEGKKVESVSENQELLIADYAWNIIPDATAQKSYHRSSNSINIEGNVAKLIGRCISESTDPALWANILLKAASKRDTSATALDVEHIPVFNSYPKAGSEVAQAMQAGFHLAFPDAKGRYTQSAEMHSIWKQTIGQGQGAIPLLQVNWVEYLDQFTDLKKVDDEIQDLFRKIDIPLDKNTLQVVLIKADEQTPQPTKTNPEDPTLLPEHYSLIKNLLTMDAFAGNIISYQQRKTGELEIKIRSVGLSFNDSKLSNDLSQKYSLETKMVQVMSQLRALGWEMVVSSNDHLYDELPKQLQLQQLQNELFAISGLATQGQKLPGGDMRIVIRHPYPSVVTNLVEALDDELIPDHPEWIARRDAEEAGAFIALVQTKKEQLAELEKASSEAIALLKETFAPIIAANPDAATNEMTERGEIAGVPLERVYRDTMFGRRPDQPSLLIESATFPEAKPDLTGREKLRSHPQHFMVSWYTYDQPAYYPVGTSATFTYSEKGITGERLAPIYQPLPNRDIWQPGTTDQSSVLQRNRDWKSDEAYNYDGIIELTQDMDCGHGAYPFGQGEVTLPIDGRLHEIAYIQLPTDDESILNPAVAYDVLNSQYALLFPNPEQKIPVRRIIPKGTRIYLKVKQPGPQTDEQTLTQFSGEQNLVEVVTTPLTDVQKLDSEAAKLLNYLKNPAHNLSREQKAVAVYAFCKKRLLYHGSQGYQTIEEAIIDGKGVCRHAGLILADLLRVAGVPSRVRAVYPDDQKRGVLRPPMHAVVEFMNSEGYWQEMDATASRESHERALQKLEKASQLQIPEIEDLTEISFAPNIPIPKVTLPKELKGLLDEIVVSPGAMITKELREIAATVRYNTKVTLQESLRYLQSYLAAEARVRKNKRQQPAPLGHQVTVPGADVMVDYEYQVRDTDLNTVISLLQQIVQQLGKLEQVGVMSFAQAETALLAANISGTITDFLLGSTPRLSQQDAGTRPDTRSNFKQLVLKLRGYKKQLDAHAPDIAFEEWPALQEITAAMAQYFPPKQAEAIGTLLQTKHYLDVAQLAPIENWLKSQQLSDPNKENTFEAYYQLRQLIEALP